MQTAVLRSELHSYIDALPERSLLALKPLLSVLSEPLYTIETDLTDELMLRKSAIIPHVKSRQ
jgi:hypothetical protein